MNEELLKMTNKELIAYCERNNIDVDSKNVSKPTKAEIYKAIQEAGDLMEESSIDVEGLSEVDEEDLDEWLDISPETMEEKIKAAAAKKPTRAQLRQIHRDTMMPLRRVLITENDKNQTTIPTQVHYSTWGSRLGGHYTDRFVCGSPWHVRQGALNNLQGMMVARSIQDEEGNAIRHETVPKYIIQVLAPLTADERETIAKRQLIRDSSIESLI